MGLLGPEFEFLITLLYSVSFADGSAGKESACEAGDRFDPWVGKIPWRRKWELLQYSCRENPMDRGAWQAIVYRVAKSQIHLSH